MKAKRITSTRYAHPRAGFTQACSVEARGRLVFLSGITARTADVAVVCPGDIEGQCRQIWTNIANILEEAGGTFADIVKTNAYVTRSEFMEVYRRTKEEFLGLGAAPGTVVQVVALYDPLQLIEIEVIALVQESK